ncbi:hypothetical protein CW667_04255 [Candidatus Bathyarchaeota archaeon]|nr:MAG: hypothetical protein CW667_04255 [Candidatus Bathyarchaeota archaeon]RLI18823.1 MAG: hypothetical protein DRO44_00105 [Candidatus Bathyarchaeota archaeon]HDD70000.1 hypothetical protein [Candidatus Bathyarchaeota archaeon]
MVVAGKVFRLLEPLSIAEIASRLEGYKLEEPYEEGDYKFTLVSEVVGLLPKENMLRGVYSHDYVMHIFHRGKVMPMPRTVEALFSFSQQENVTFLTVVEKKRLANFIANKLSEILFEKLGGVLEARIPPETLREFHLKNPEDTKITFFDNVDIPNVNKLSLYGPDLINTSLFEDYCRRGDLWYVVARSKEYGYVVGVTRDASVTIFNLTDKERYLEYVVKEIYPLITV